MKVIMRKTWIRQVYKLSTTAGRSENLSFTVTLRNRLSPAIKSLMAVANDRLNAQVAGLMKKILSVIKLN